MIKRTGRLRAAVARGALAATRATGARLGQHVTVANMHSVIPVLPPESDSIWRRRAEIGVDVEAAFALVEGPLAEFTAEFPEAIAPYARYGLAVSNGLYDAADAELLYATVRRAKPARVLELGSGFSTMITAAACTRNAAEGEPARLLAVDPEPRTEVEAAIADVGAFERRDARELKLDQFEELEDGDILFIDTSHVVKLGSEVNWLFLEVLPRLATGVRVQIHDIFLPYEYPRARLVASGFFNEQYLLQALLLENPNWTIELPVYALATEQPERARAALPSLGRAAPGYFPSAFWIRRVNGAAPPSAS